MEGIKEKMEEGERKRVEGVVAAEREAKEARDAKDKMSREMGVMRKEARE